MIKFNEFVEVLLEKNYFKGDKKDPNDLKDFISKRAAGAKKIASTAEKKGKYSLLTAVHFQAKEVPYDISSKHIDDKGTKFIKSKADKCFQKLKSWDKMSQREFQKVMGELEAYGEVYIRFREVKDK